LVSWLQRRADWVDPLSVKEGTVAVVKKETPRSRDMIQLLHELSDRSASSREYSTRVWFAARVQTYRQLFEQEIFETFIDTPTTSMLMQSMLNELVDGILYRSLRRYARRGTFKQRLWRSMRDRRPRKGAKKSGK